jgi:hypothetical protein
MIALIRFFAVLLVVQTIAYVVISIRSRRIRRGKLEAQWDAEDMTGDRDAFVEAGLREYDGSLRAKLLLGIYVVPIVGVIVIIQIVN